MDLETNDGSNVIEDRRQQWPVQSREVLAEGRVMSFVEEVIDTPSGDTMVRQFTTHPGAVAIVAWDEERDEIAVLLSLIHI